MGLDRKQPGIKVLGVAVEGKDSQRGDPRRQPRQIFGSRICQTRERGHYRSAVHDRERFLGAQMQGRDTGCFERCGGRQRRAVVPDFAVAAQHRGEIG